MTPMDRVASSARRGPGVWNVANALTMSRIALVPIYGWLLLRADGTSPDYRWMATAVFAVAMLTDRIDGSLARSRGLVTDFGKITDPIADKLLTGMAFVGLSVIGELWWWITIVVLSRGVIITGMRLLVLRRVVIPASRGGKLKTVLQALALGLLSAPLTGPVRLLAGVVMAAAVIVTVWTGYGYLASARAALAAPKPTGGT